MFYWAPTEAKGIEVDFLVRAGRSFVAVEAKSGGRVRPEWFTGLRAIAELAGLKRRIVVHTGTQSVRTDDGIDVLTVEDFLRELDDRTLV